MTTSLKIFTQRFLLLILLLICITMTNGAWADTNNIHANNDPAVEKFIQEVASKYHFKPAALQDLFNQAKINQKALDLMDSPYESKPWYIYQKHFLSQARVDQGVQFWNQYKTQLNAISKRTGVPPEIIVAIIGVESHYGKLKGQFSAFDVLYTFSFHYPRRETFFKNELKEFLLLCREQKLDPLTVTASYAGALGQPQFMPSSYRAYAKPYIDNGQVNLFNNESDVIASIGNYFFVHGWQANQLITAKAIVKGTAYQDLLAQSSMGNTSRISKPSLTLKELAAKNVHSSVKLPMNTKAILMAFDLEQGQEYWLGFNNFYMITRYNTSKLYAMAVDQLAELIKQRHADQHQT